MLVGHLGAALAAKAIEPRMKLGTLFAAALFVDVVFWLLVLAGVEHIAVPADFAVHHLYAFDFPFSHSLIGTVLLAVLFAFVWAVWGGRRARRHGAYWDGIALIAATVLSHWLLDVLVHGPDMPAVPGGLELGIGLWRYQPLAFLVEMGLVMAAFAAFAVRSSLSTGRKIVAGVTVAVAAGLTLEGVYGTPANDPAVTAVSGLMIIGLCVAAAAWADRSR